VPESAPRERSSALSAHHERVTQSAERLAETPIPSASECSREEGTDQVEKQLKKPESRSQWRLLFLLPFPPRLDATHGGGRAAAHLLANLANRHRIALLYLRAPADPPLDPVLQERCELVEEVVRPNPGFSLASGWARIRSLLRGWPLWVAGCSVAAYGARLRTIARTWRPHIVQIEYHVMAQYLSALDGYPAPRVLTEHEPGISAACDLWQSVRGISRVIRYFDMLAWKRFEQTITKRVHAIVVFTERDREVLAPIVGKTSIIRIPLTTTPPKQPLDPHGEDSLSLLFIGNFIHPPNVDAAARLIKVILPQVQARIPGAVLRIVGDNPPAQLAKLAKPSVIVTGRVPDVTPYLDRAAVVVVPLRMGGGMRVKVLEALAAGKAVVASALAAEGFDLVDGEQVILAKSDQQFSDAIVQLLADPERRALLAGRARAWACANLDWGKSIAAYEALYQSLIECSCTAQQM
jgi:glycosyltransferase involved in cell wall biosynthesis